MSFQLDPSGSIALIEPEARVTIWDDLDAFTQGYVEALFASERATDVTKADWLPDAEAVAAPGSCTLPCDVGFSDLAPETLARIIVDCEAISRMGLPAKSEHHPRAGRSAWEWRQMQQLPGFPPLTVQLGDDGKVRFA